MVNLKRSLTCFALLFPLIFTFGCSRMNQNTNNPEYKANPSGIISPNPSLAASTPLTKEQSEPPSTTKENKKDSTTPSPEVIEGPNGTEPTIEPIESIGTIKQQTINTNDQTDCKEYSYSELTNEESELINNLDDLFNKNIFYEVPEINGEIKYDFDKDGKVESFILSKNRYGNGNSSYEVFTLIIGYGKVEITSTDERGIIIGLCDIDKSDNSVEVIVRNVDLNEESDIYKLENKNIKHIVSLDHGVSAVSGDGKVYSGVGI